ncbi:MAG: alpha/beta hydrolase [Pseudomonadaceae bacterium]|nr:MAG: alpha/beta hydrolase [Pseudomonadaceae bacterium]
MQLNRVLRLGAVLALSYVAIVLLMWLFQERLLFLPGVGREHIATPDDIGLYWRAVELTTEDDLTLDAWWLPAENPRAAMLFLHGNAGNISHRLDSLEQFNQLGLSVLILDYRGYGQSEGRPSERGTALDADAGWQWLQAESGHDPERLVIFGRSLGAAVAAELATRTDPAALILESAFRSVPDLGQQLYPWLPVRTLARLTYPTVDYVAQQNAPVLVIHSEDDEIIPFAEGQAVYEAASAPKALLVIEGDHNTGFLRSERVYLPGIDDFLSGAGLAR